MEVELLKIVQGGGGPLVVCIGLVVLFLRHINQKDDAAKVAMKEMTERFTEEHAESRKAFQDQISSLTSKVFDIAEKTTTAVSDLRGAIQELRQKIHDN